MSPSYQELVFCWILPARVLKFEEYEMLQSSQMAHVEVMGGSSDLVWYSAGMQYFEGRGLYHSDIFTLIPSGAENRKSQPKCQSRAHQFLSLGKPGHNLEKVCFRAAYAQIPVRRMVPFGECYTLDGSPRFSLGVWSCKISLSLS